MVGAWAWAWRVWLWTCVVLVARLAIARDVLAVARDARCHLGLAWCGGAWLLAVAAASWRGRARWGADRWGLALLVLGLAVLSHARAAGHTSVATIEGGMPSVLRALPVVLSPLAIVWLHVARDLRAWTLAFVVAALTASGRVSGVDGPVALMLAVGALSAQGACTRLELDADLRAAWRPRGPLLVVVLFGLWLGLTGLDTVDVPATRASMAWLVAWLLVAWALAARPRDVTAWRRLLAVPVLASLTVALAQIALTVFLWTRLSATAVLATRLPVLGWHPNFLAASYAGHAVLALGLATCAWRAARPERRVRALVWIAAALALAAATWQTQSMAGRTALLCGVALALAGVSLAGRAAARRAVCAAGVLVVAMVFAGPWLAQGLPDDFVGGMTRGQASLEYRRDAWANSAAVIAAHPWTGVGAGTRLTVLEFEAGSRYARELAAPHPHNVALAALQAGGVPAGILLAAWMLWVFVRLARRADELAAGASAALATVLACGLLDVGTALDGSAPELAFLLAGLASAPQRLVPRRARASSVVVGAAVAIVLAVIGIRPVLSATALARTQTMSLDASLLAVPSLRERAADELARARSWDPWSPGVLLLSARWAESEGRNDDARTAFAAMADAAPHRSESYAAAAGFLDRAHEWDAAAAALALSEATQHEGVRREELRALHVTCLVKAGRLDEARERLEAAIMRRPRILDEVPWVTSGDDQTIVEGGVTLSLGEVLETTFGQLKEAGGSVSEWMSVYESARKAGRDQLAERALDNAEALGANPASVLSERARMAEDAGAEGAARSFLERGWTTTGLDVFRTRLASLDGELSEVADPLAMSVDIVRAPTAWRDELRASADASERAGHDAEAAARHELLLLFEDDITERAMILARVAQLNRAAEDWQGVERAVAEALDHWHAKQVHPATLRDEWLLGAADGTPVALAHTLDMTWRDAGMSRDQRLERAWTLPNIHSTLLGPAAFRLALWSELGRVDALLREARTQLLANRDDTMATWAAVSALEGLARFDEARRLVADHARVLSADVALETTWERYAAQLVRDPTDVETLLRAGVIAILRRDHAAADLVFSQVRTLTEHRPAVAASAETWRGRAAWLAGNPDLARAAWTAALELTPDDTLLRKRLEALR